jgi:hypothetical protein
MDSKDYSRLKSVIELHEYIETIGSDRPSVGVFLKGLNITPQTMQDAVVQTASACSIAVPEAAFHICNHLFKLGLTIGYKYAVKKSMEEEFNMEQNDEEPN